VYCLDIVLDVAKQQIHGTVTLEPQSIARSLFLTSLLNYLAYCKPTVASAWKSAYSLDCLPVWHFFDLVPKWFSISTFSVPTRAEIPKRWEKIKENDSKTKSWSTLSLKKIINGDNVSCSFFLQCLLCVSLSNWFFFVFSEVPAGQLEQVEECL